ncbi:MAG: TonB-dependent receptor [Bryobacterales bacterium]|nr:TonB-dependent receptor [Bryobacterales bacterium]
MQRKVLSYSVATLLLLITVCLQGQVVSAGLFGTVTDPNGAVIPGAKVTVTNEDRGSTLTRDADASGVAAFPSLPMGTYTITVESQGFKSLKRSGIVLSAGRDLRLTLPLELGQVTETIEVHAETPLVNTSNAEQRSNIEAFEVQDLPTARRDWTGLLALTPGAQVGSASVRMNGLPAASMRITVDGTDATEDNEQPSFAMNGGFNLIKGVSTEAVAEVNMAKGIASAEIANTMSGNINIITKSGTNDFHGSAFWLNNTENLNARNQFLKNKPGLTFNQFGGSFGGPIIRNRIFFFGVYEGYRLRGFQPLNGQVPTSEFRARVLAANPAYQKMFDTFPLPNQAYSAGAITGGWVGASSEQANDDHATLKGDYNITSTTILSTRWTRSRPFRMTPRVNTANNRTWEGTVEQGTANVTHATTAWTYESRLGVNYNRTPRLDHYFSLTSADPAYNGINGLGFDVDGELNAREGITWSFEQNAGTQIGRHALKFGGIFLQQHARRVNVETPILTYSSEADLIANIPDAVQATLGVREFDLRTNTLGFFVQDDFRLTNRLMINMGIRWDYFSVPKERDHRLFNREQPFGTGPYTNPDAIWNPDRNNFAPRLGFAYQLTESGKTVLRGGAGMFYSPIPLFAGPVDLVRDALDEPFRVNVSRADVLVSGNVFRWPVSNDTVRQYVKGSTGLIGDTAVNTNYPTPFSYQWTLGIQHEFPGGIALDTAYVGNRGMHLQMVRTWNQVDRTTGIRPVPGFTQFQYRDPSESTGYHAWQTSVRKRFAAGLNLGLGYTFASAFSYTGQADLIQPVSVQDAYNFRADRGRPDDYLRHNFTTDFVYELPFARLSSSDSRLVRNALAGWQLSGIFTARSGNPINITQSTAFAGSRADVASGTQILGNYRETLRYLDVGAFSRVPIGAVSGAPIRPGNIGRNALTNIGWWNWDVSAAKRFFLTEKLEGKLEAQMLNVFNHTNLSGLQTNITSGNFGRFTSTRGARVIQLNLRFSF